MANNNGFSFSGAGAGAGAVGRENIYDNLWNLYLEENPLPEEPELLQVEDPDDDQDHILNDLWGNLASSGQPDAHSASQDDKSGAEKVDDNDDDVGQQAQNDVSDDDNDDDAEDQRNKPGDPDTSNDTVDKSNIPSLADGDHEGANDGGGSESKIDYGSNEGRDESGSDNSFAGFSDEGSEDESDESGDETGSDSSFAGFSDEGSEDEHDEGPKDEHDEGPKDEHDESSKDEHDQGPKDEHDKGPEDENDADHGSNASEDEFSSNSSYDRIFGQGLEGEAADDGDHESNASEDDFSSNSSYDRIFGQGPEAANTSIQHGEFNQQTIINVFQSTDFNKKFNKLFDNELSAHFHEVVDGVGNWSEDEDHTNTRESPPECDQAVASIEEPTLVSGAVHQASNEGTFPVQLATAAYNGDPVPQQIGGVFDPATHRFSFDIDRLNARFVLSRILWGIISGSRLIGYANWSTQSFFDIFANTWVHLPSPINLNLNSSERFRPFRIVEKNSIELRYRNALTLVFDEYAGEMLYKLAPFNPPGNPPLAVPPPEDDQNFFDFYTHDQAASFLDPAQAATDANLVQYPNEGFDFGTLYTGTEALEPAAEPFEYPFADLAPESLQEQATHLFADPTAQPLAGPDIEPLEELTTDPATQPTTFAPGSIHGSTSQAVENWIPAPSAWPAPIDRTDRGRRTDYHQAYRPTQEYQSYRDIRDTTAPSQGVRNGWQPNFATDFNMGPSTSNYTPSNYLFDHNPLNRSRPSEGMLDNMAFARVTGVYIPGSEHYQQEIDERVRRNQEHAQRFQAQNRTISPVPEATGNSLSDFESVSPSSSGSSSHKRKASTAADADDVNDEDYNEHEAVPSPPKRRSPERSPPLTTPSRRRRRRVAEIITRPDGTTVRRNANGSIPIPGAPRGRASAWTDAEDDFAIQFVRMIKESDRTIRIDDLWVEAADRMQQMGFHRSADSIKNQWNRRLRAKSGFDERATPRSDAMTTGELGTNAPKVGRVRKGGPRS